MQQLVKKIINNYLRKKVFFFISQYNSYKNEKLLSNFKRVGKNVKIEDYTVINFPENIIIGDNVVINSFVHMWGKGGIDIGNNVLIAAQTSITSITHDKNTIPYKEKNIFKEVIIEDNVWIGTGATILPGVKIGQNSIIGAGSVVTKNIPANSIAYGSPAKARITDRTINN